MGKPKYKAVGIMLRTPPHILGTDEIIACCCAMCFYELCERPLLANVGLFSMSK